MLIIAFISLPFRHTTTFSCSSRRYILGSKNSNYFDERTNITLRKHRPRLQNVHLNFYPFWFTEYESLISTTDAELLKRAWWNEKAATEILKFEAALVQRSRQQIQLMVETVEEFTRNGIDPLTVSLYQMDLDRTLFLLRSYLRTRLQKIEKYVLHIQKTAELWNRLSKQEQKFAVRCIGDLTQHLEQSMLSKLPDQYQSNLKQSGASEDDDMVPEPKLDTYIICRSKKFLGAFQLDDSGEEPVNIEADDLYAFLTSR